MTADSKAHKRLPQIDDAMVERALGCSWAKVHNLSPTMMRQFLEAALSSPPEPEEIPVSAGVFEALREVAINRGVYLKATTIHEMCREAERVRREELKAQEGAPCGAVHTRISGCFAFPARNERSGRGRRKDDRA
jgi:hypothetical protein